MPPISFALWLLVLVFDTGGQLAFKAASGVPGEGLDHWRAMAVRPWLWLGIAAFAFEFVTWLAFLSVVPLAEGVLLSCLNMAAVMLGGRWLFGERLTARRLLGVTLITLGVVLVGVG